ncbi:glucose-6-phosphate isomerase [Cysteiniphilum sp. QT6929]|uniref:glucose-6-phosphate isomerase n=1 Tax=Cysteiniphilum sp. QT6929 TaxID=2975055 RepID=UPI0024B38DA4|nr:glucose-6-phosphate isomerase [Cysteiniphilum sp. QT6929]WHN66426.1 glucose-6-phosphate isomerase [Cysteiniphilum sp. QT6929]
MNQHIRQQLQHLLKTDYSSLDIKSLFKEDEDRFNKYHLQVGSLLLDYSKNKLTDDILARLFELARDAKVEKYRDKMFAGEKINTSEHRAVLHTALRDFSDQAIMVDGVDVKPEIIKERLRVKALVEKVHNGQWRGHSGKKITDVVNIGIGGSDLGPRMVVEALAPYHLNKTKVHFVSNVDAESILSITTKLNPETTLFIVASKSFTTQETLMNAMTARKWLLEFYQQDQVAVAKHFVAVSSALDKVEAFGIDLDNCFQMWDWVGGRYSLWSSIGMAIVFAIGFANFEDLLKGAFAMDNHFKSAPLTKSMPIIVALIATLYSDFYHTQSQAILAYDERLRHLVDYLQQADMESNGKSCKKDGSLSPEQTGVVLWGGVGTNGQHAFHQLLHQGNVIVPADFIAIKKPHHSLKDHHQALLANCLAQSQALMQGKSLNEVIDEFKAQGLAESEINTLAPQKVIAGNKPSNTIVIDKLTPHALGELIALYEHKIFVQGILWGINSFDQWGVELGKALGKPILMSLEQQDFDNESYDSSTKGLLKYIS